MEKRLQEEEKSLAELLQEAEKSMEERLREGQERYAEHEQNRANILLVKKFLQHIADVNGFCLLLVSNPSEECVDRSMEQLEDKRKEFELETLPEGFEARFEATTGTHFGDWLRTVFLPACKKLNEYHTDWLSGRFDRAQELPSSMDIPGPNDDAGGNLTPNSGSKEVIEEEQATDNPVNSAASSNNNEMIIMEEEEFLSKIRQSIDNQEPLDLSGYQVTLTKGAIRLKGRDKLEIHGGCIQGAIHSLFQIDGDKKNNPRRLTLHQTTLIHTKEHEDPREIGAAVFAMGSCVVVLQGCTISSKGGFAVWAKHRCNITVDTCRIHDVARTAVACFNSVQVTVSNTSIARVGIHGVCGRGTSTMTLQNVTIDHCQTRAVMVYHGASLSLEDCSIINTHDPTTPTIHAQGPPESEQVEDKKAGEEDKQKTDPTTLIPSLRMKRCTVSHSAGPPLLMEGLVHEELVDNQILS